MSYHQNSEQILYENRYISSRYYSDNSKYWGHLYRPLTYTDLFVISVRFSPRVLVLHNLYTDEEVLVSKIYRRSQRLQFHATLRVPCTPSTKSQITQRHTMLGPENGQNRQPKRYQKLFTCETIIVTISYENSDSFDWRLRTPKVKTERLDEQCRLWEPLGNEKS